MNNPNLPCTMLATDSLKKQISSSLKEDHVAADFVNFLAPLIGLPSRII